MEAMYGKKIESEPSIVTGECLLLRVVCFNISGF